MSTTNQLELPASLKIKSALGKRDIAISSLRPGAWLETDHGNRIIVLQNWNSVQRIELKWGDRNAHVYDHSHLHFYNPTYLGTSPRRQWHPLLPKWAQKWINPYSGPKK